MALRVTLKPTANRKLVGNNKHLPFYATYREVGTSCPTNCSLLNNGCYAQFGNVRLQSIGTYSTEDGKVFLRELKRIPHGAALRLHVSGDVMADGDLDVDYLDAIILGAKERPDVKMYGYTHAWRVIDRKRFVFPENLTLSASCEQPEEVKEARAAGWDTVIVLPYDIKGKRFGDVVVCPNQTVGMTCDKCRLCFKPNRSLTVGFKAHGRGRLRVTSHLSHRQDK